MLSKEVVILPKIATNELFAETTNQFLKPFKEIIEPDIHNGMYLNFDIDIGSGILKESPVIRLAKSKDAKEITEIYKEVYNGTYPYKEMENEEKVRKMIESSNFIWLIFENKMAKIVGCFTYQLNFKERRGYMRGFMLKKKFQGQIDAVKATIGSMIGMWSTYKDKILMWYCENRTAHTKSQYMASVCGIKPIAFFPNKDVFFNEIESDIMSIIYDKKVIYEYRSKKNPKIIPEALNCFYYSTNRYKLGPIDIINPEINLNPLKLIEIKKKIRIKIQKDKFGYETIEFSIKNSNSYFKFLFTPQVQNIEKVKYFVDNIEELFVFIQEFKRCAKEFNVRYYEIFVSAYEPYHQKLLLNAGLKPRGYLPSWKYNEKLDFYEDNIIFNYFRGNINKNIKLIRESSLLLTTLGEYK
ncbi:MAG: hypothetical protein EU532_10650 [Promethearchaeota archaeon]|nr:MAG: hypothetical protein EU532_10650 [Candidatus Lokiarchaeota archaeon]